MASQITSLTIVYSTVYSGADHRKYQSSASPDFVQGIHRWPVNSPHKGPVTRKLFPFDDVIMERIGSGGGLEPFQVVSRNPRQCGVRKSVVKSTILTQIKWRYLKAISEYLFFIDHKTPICCLYCMITLFCAAKYNIFKTEKVIFYVLNSVPSF